jgi:hypothetical protein
MGDMRRWKDGTGNRRSEPLGLRIFMLYYLYIAATPMAAPRDHSVLVSAATSARSVTPRGGRALNNQILNSGLTPRLRPVLITWAVACLGACATPPRATPAQMPAAKSPDAATATVAKDADIQCHSERPTGTLLATKICTTREQRRVIAEHAQDVKDKIDRSIVPACPGTPGCGG